MGVNYYQHGIKNYIKEIFKIIRISKNIRQYLVTTKIPHLKTGYFPEIFVCLLVVISWHSQFQYMNLLYVFHCWPRMEFLEPEITFGMSIRADEICAVLLLLFALLFSLYISISTIFLRQDYMRIYFIYPTQIFLIFFNQRNCSAIIPFDIACPRFSPFFLQFLLNCCQINSLGSPCFVLCFFFTSLDVAHLFISCLPSIYHSIIHSS